MNHVEVIQGSLVCLKRGWLSLIPVVGICFAILAIASFARALRATESDWNPAKWHLLSGVALALLSFLAHGMVGIGVLGAMLQ